MNRSRHALIIGGGIAGPVTAMALQRARITASVYEAHPADARAAGRFSASPSTGWTRCAPSICIGR
jgi:2-polyprenyl-6-methoxyphenol hydroxylase-like FAD-dependent oxidoreductase